jgi:hypothetical protein
LLPSRKGLRSAGAARFPCRTKNLSARTGKLPFQRVHLPLGAGLCWFHCAQSACLSPSSRRVMIPSTNYRQECKTHKRLAVPVLMLSPAGPLADRARAMVAACAARDRKANGWNAAVERVCRWSLRWSCRVVAVFCMVANGFGCPTRQRAEAWPRSRWQGARSDRLPKMRLVGGSQAIFNDQEAARLGFRILNSRWSTLSKAIPQFCQPHTIQPSPLAEPPKQYGYRRRGRFLRSRGAAGHGTAWSS